MIAGIGTDLIELNRVEKVISRLTKRILTPDEQVALPESPVRRLEFVAGRFAAKEAVSKAMGSGIGKMCSFQDIEVLNNEQGKPVVTVSPRVLQALYGTGAVSIHLSISHSEHYAMAMAVIEIDHNS
jgi:holo-[acyl-carrier protein] synthase